MYNESLNQKNISEKKCKKKITRLLVPLVDYKTTCKKKEVLVFSGVSDGVKPKSLDL